MEQLNCNTQRAKYTHLKEFERYKLEALLATKIKVKKITEMLGRSKATIYREITRGSVPRLQYDLSEKKQYRANVGERKHHENSQHKKRRLKIAMDRPLEQYIRRKVLKDRYSPDAVIGDIKLKGLKFKHMICTKTLYNYIDAGILSGISNLNLWEKRKKRKRRYRTVSRVSRNNRLGKSIEERPAEANDRSEYGHWEGDCLKSPQGHSTSLLTLTERKTLEQIMIKIERSSQEEIKSALDQLEAKLGPSFTLKFKSITFDNGVEFLDWQSLEISVLDPTKKRTTVYFAHAYSAWERGSNENQNKMIRRFILKKTDIHDINQLEIRTIQNWINNYPRKRLGYKSANQVALENFQINRLKGLDFVSL